MEYLYDRCQYVNVIKRASEEKGTDFQEEAYIVDRLVRDVVKGDVSRITTAGYTLLAYPEDDNTTTIEFFYDSVGGDMDFIQLSKESMLELHRGEKAQ